MSGITPVGLPKEKLTNSYDTTGDQQGEDGHCSRITKILKEQLDLEKWNCVQARDGLRRLHILEWKALQNEKKRGVKPRTVESVDCLIDPVRTLLNILNSEEIKGQAVLRREGARILRLYAEAIERHHRVITIGIGSAEKIKLGLESAIKSSCQDCSITKQAIKYTLLLWRSIPNKSKGQTNMKGIKRVGEKAKGISTDPNEGGKAAKSLFNMVKTPAKAVHRKVKDWHKPVKILRWKMVDVITGNRTYMQFINEFPLVKGKVKLDRRKAFALAEAISSIVKHRLNLKNSMRINLLWRALAGCSPPKLSRNTVSNDSGEDDERAKKSSSDSSDSDEGNKVDSKNLQKEKSGTTSTTLDRVSTLGQYTSLKNLIRDGGMDSSRNTKRYKVRKAALVLLNELRDLKIEGFKFPDELITECAAKSWGFEKDGKHVRSNLTTLYEQLPPNIQNEWKSKQFIDLLDMAKKREKAHQTAAKIWTTTLSKMRGEFELHKRTDGKMTELIAVHDTRKPKPPGESQDNSSAHRNYEKNLERWKIKLDMLRGKKEENDNQLEKIEMGLEVLEEIDLILQYAQYFVDIGGKREMTKGFL